LNQVVHFMLRDASEQDAVNHARVEVVEASKGGAVPIARGTDEPIFFV
jgi:hypothetical protein